MMIHSLMLLTTSLLLIIGASEPTPFMTIKSPDGDLIDCIDILDQPAFKNPLLKNHKIQEFPTDMQKMEEKKEKDITNWQVWHTAGKKCPKGTVPIRRHIGGTDISHQKYPKVSYEASSEPTKGHKYAIGFIENGGKIYGTRTTLNVWDPMVEASDDFSLAQIWLTSGTYDNGSINTVEAGWQVSPDRYHDHQPRLFTYWTRDAYNLTGCYATHCGGFVQTSSTIALEAAISRTSTLGGTQLDITIQIWKDQFTGHWWLGIGLKVVPVGYWPAEIFTGLSDHATSVQWGGEVFYRNSSGKNTIAQMGSGEFADKGFSKAAYICNIRVAEDNHSLLPVNNFEVFADYPKYYTIKKWKNKECGSHFFYGGPGPRPACSGAVHETFAYVFIFLYFVFLVCV